MVDKKKMSVAEMLAAARGEKKAGGAEGPAPKASGSAGRPSVAEMLAAARGEKKAGGGEGPAPKASGTGGRPSVAEMLAAARGKKPAVGEKKPAPKEAKPAPKGVPAATAKAAPKPAKKALAAEAPTRRFSTSSILSTTGREKKPGPMSKAEAAALTAPTTESEKKKVIELPPLPIKPVLARSDREGAPIQT